jgi:hypothetical protein
MKDADFSKWTSTEKIAQTLKEWAESGQYPSDTFYRV